MKTLTVLNGKSLFSFNVYENVFIPKGKSFQVSKKWRKRNLHQDFH